MGNHVLSYPSSEGGQPVSYFSSPDYDEIWGEAEQNTGVLLGQIQPSKRSEESRKAVINYVQRLIERELDCKIFSFGSVPLKTYLPDGDIDLTAISRHHGLNDDWAKKVSAVLEREEHVYDSDFHVKEVKYIVAEVPVVKCLVENIIVDITFNQLGGLSTLCFLEEVDTLIGRDHLFKRSIILVKAWCFYESRILGAHHGLLSTYALEVLVLYIFHVFHQSLRGPLEVLFRFLQFYSKFDWELNCLTLKGPVPLHSMTEVSPLSSNGNVLLSEDFLKACREKYSTLAEINQAKTFSQKYMNLMDPLRPFNNLGRSVNSGNLVRIYSAFAYGATQLEKLLQSPKEQACENLALFFRNTQKHCQGHRPDAGVLTLRLDISPCNGKLSSDEATADVTALSNGLNDVVRLRHGIADGAADKPVCGNVDHPSLQVHRGLVSVDRSQTSESDAMDAAILKGNHETYFQNLKAGLLYRNSHVGRNFFTSRSLHSQGSSWEGPGRPAYWDCFPQNSSGRKNLPIHGGSSGGLNNSLSEAFPKHHRGTGTFFPQLKVTFERDRRSYSNGGRSPQTLSGNTDSFDSSNHNASSGSRSRPMLKKRDGTSKPKFRKNLELKTTEQQQDLPTKEDVLQGPTMEMIESFAYSPQGHGDSEVSSDLWLDWSPRSLDSAVFSPIGTSKDLPLEKLEFGSFGPGFLAKGLQKPSQKEYVDCSSPNQHPSPRGANVETQAPAPKAGDIADQQISAYQLKEEDFPPLSLTSHRELPSAVVAERNSLGTQGSYQQACVLSSSSKATKVAQNR